jgi:hypothetical protein
VEGGRKVTDLAVEGSFIEVDAINHLEASLLNSGSLRMMACRMGSRAAVVINQVALAAATLVADSAGYGAVGYYLRY